MPVWIQIDAYDPVASAAVTLRAAQRDDVSSCMAAGGPWWPMIAKAPVLRYDLFDGAFGSEISAPTTSFALQVEAWPNFGRYAIADARVRIWVDITAGPIFDGRVTAQPQLADGQAQISIKVDDSWLDKALLSTYAGTTGLEGPAALKGQPKPLALGAPRYVAGKLIDSVNNVFQVSAYGPIQGFEAVLERLSREFVLVGDYPTYAALVAASVPAGCWAASTAQGLVRFGAPTTGQVSFLLQGDAAGPDGWARKPGQLIRRLALLAGGAGLIDDASLNALDAARPYNLSLYVDQQTTARQLIQSIAASVNAVAGVSWTGKLFVVPVELGTPTMTLSADGSALPPVRSVEQLEVAAPFAKIAIEAQRTWTVHQLADIAFVDPLVDMGAYDGGAYYRPGNIVQYSGASWRYKSTAAPGSGNPPPTPPATSNTWWTVLAEKGAPGASGSDGDPGSDGADGIDALSVSLAPSAVSVPSTAGGTPKEALPGSQFMVFKGAADVTSSTAYAVTAVSNLSGVSVDASGAITVTGIAGGASNLTGWADITATKDGASQAVRLVYTKALDGAAFVDGSAEMTAPASTSYSTAAELDLLMGPSGTISFDTSGGFSVPVSTANNVQGVVSYSLDGGTTWSSVGSFTGNGATPGAAGDWAFTGAVSGASIGLLVKQVVRWKVEMRKTSSSSLLGFDGQFYVAWKG